MTKLLKIHSLISWAIISLFVYILVRGPRGMTPYMQGYLQGSMNATRIHGEVIRDARRRGVI